MVGTDTRVIAVARSERRVGEQVNGDAFVIADLDGGPSRHHHHGDEFTVGARGVLVAVADGVGGSAAKDVASRLAVTSLLSSLHATASRAVASALDLAFASAHAEILREAREPGRHGMSTTLTAVVILPGIAYVAAVGDSPVYLARGSRLLRLTRDQTFAEMLVDRGVLSPAQAARSAHRSVLLQALGGDADVIAAVSALEVWRGDTLLVCSDGLTSCVSDDEIQSVLAREFDLQEAADALVALARARGDGDVTVVLARVGGSELAWPALSRDVEPRVRTLRPFDFTRYEPLADGEDALVPMDGCDGAARPAGDTVGRMRCAAVRAVDAVLAAARALARVLLG